MAKVGYRLRVYAPRSVDPTEQTVLTPIAGAGHSDPLQVATVELPGNLLDNSSLAVDSAGWVGLNTTAAVRDATKGYDDGASLRFTTLNSSGSGVVIQLRAGRPTVVPGRTYTFSIYVDGTNAVGKVFNVRIAWWDASTVNIDNTMIPVTLVAGWQRVSVTGVAPAGAATCQGRLLTNGAQGVFDVWADGAQIHEGAAPGLYQPTTTSPAAPYRPYLEPPRGRRGKVDLLTKKVPKGTQTFEVCDKRLTAGGSNLARWLSAILGNQQGEPQPLGLRVEVDFSEDVTAELVAWERWYTGRLDEAELATLNSLLLHVSDATAELDAEIFVGRPHSSVTYAREPQAWPMGLTGSYGGRAAAPTLTGVVGPAKDGNPGKSVVLTKESQNAPHNIVPDALRKCDVPLKLIGKLPKREIYYDGGVMARLVWGSGTVGEFQVGGISTTVRSIIDRPGKADAMDHGFEVYEVLVRQAPGGPALPADGTTVQISIRLPEFEPSDELPLYLDDVHPVQLLADALDGKFGYRKADGSVLRSYARNAASFAALVADPTFGTARCRITKRWKLNAFIEAICQQFALGYRVNEYGEVVVFDCRTPSSVAGIPTISAAAGDIDTKAKVGWSLSREHAITQLAITRYLDLPLAIGELSLDGGVAPSDATSLLKELERTVLYKDFGRLDLGERSFEIDAFALRGGPGEVTDGASRDSVLRGRMDQLAAHLRNVFGFGVTRVTLPCRRTATVKALREGQLVFYADDRLPNPGTNARGGTRLGRLEEVQWEAGTARLVILDLGPNVVMATPTIGALSAEAGNPSHGINVPVTLNAAGNFVSLEYAVTPTSVAARPTSGWLFARQVKASGTVVVGNLPSGRRIWFRARSDVSTAGGPRIPSAYAYPAGAGYLDTAALAAPTGFSVTVESELATVVRWTNAVPNTPVRIWLATPNTGTLELLTTVFGATEFRIAGTVAGTTYRVKIQHWDGVTSSPFATNPAAPANDYIDFTAAGAPQQAEALLGIAGAEEAFLEM